MNGRTIQLCDACGAEPKSICGQTWWSGFWLWKKKHLCIKPLNHGSVRYRHAEDTRHTCSCGAGFSSCHTDRTNIWVE